jgi:hypothetical protein
VAPIGGVVHLYRSILRHERWKNALRVEIHALTRGGVRLY